MKGHIGGAGPSLPPAPVPLAKKLGVKPGQLAHLVGAPCGWSIPALPEGARLVRKRREGVAAHGRRT
jgi:hypothetical protein